MDHPARCSIHALERMHGNGILIAQDHHLHLHLHLQLQDQDHQDHLDQGQDHHHHLQDLHLQLHLMVVAVVAVEAATMPLSQWAIALHNIQEDALQATHVDFKFYCCEK